MQRVDSLFYFFLYLYRRRGLFLRSLLCLGIGYLALTQDETNSYDARFYIRGEQSPSQLIKIIDLSPSDFALKKWPDQYNDSNNMDYWDQKLWQQMLTQVLARNPQKIVVNINFPQSLLSSLDQNTRTLFSHEKIIWTKPNIWSERDNNLFYSQNPLTNIGNNSFPKDEDGVIRRLSLEETATPHITEQMSPQSFSAMRKKVESNSILINFRGSKNSFEKIDLRDLFENKIEFNKLRNKIILIGSTHDSNQQLLTAVGWMSKTELLAHAVDNIINKRWITRSHNSAYAIGLLLLMILSVFAITHYPQAVALFFLMWIGTLILALSAWVFDIFYFWIPALSAWVQILATWIIFVGYMATNIERKHWALQQEQKYLHELEQLKNNFISLISHDLKTPIAKIQAIVDRLIVQHPDIKLQEDLKSLRLSSEELNKYIQSILKVMRVESRDFQLHKEIADINQLIEEAILHLNSLAKEKNITINMHLEPLFSIELDPHLMIEVIQNLIENAIKYTPQNGTITIESKELQENVIFTVKDTGEGIEKEELDNIWGKFVRGKNQDLKTKGTGLGLYLVKYFIELHGGQVFLESEKGLGTTVGFKLPVEMDEEKNNETA